MGKMEKQHDLRIIFIGTPDFAVESLDALIAANKNVVAVITAPDRKSGRGQKINTSAVKNYALLKGIPILQPTNLKNERFLEELASYRADLQIVVAFRMLPETVWNMPSRGTFNLHASLLPNYRGAAPINWAIINGERETGVTTFFLKHQIDTGNIILQEKVKITPNETAGSLHDKLMKTGGNLVVKTVSAIQQNNISTVAQPESESNEAPKIFKEDCRIDWKSTSELIDRQVRGLSPYPTAWTKISFNDEQKELNFKIFDISVLEENSMAEGEIKVNERRLFVGTKTSDLEILDCQLEGKRKMTAKELINGFNFQNTGFN
jgi:methionyl-tRNA formyltransferase